MSFMWDNITSNATVNKPSSQRKKKKKRHHTTQRCNFGKADN